MIGNDPEEEKQLKKYKARERFNTGRGPEESFDKLSPDMKEFVEELYSLYPGVVFTSGFRGKDSDKKDSLHYTGEAVDVAPDPMLWDTLLNSKQGIELLTKYNLGVLDETNPKTKKKTGATGDHFHIGKDTELFKKVQKRKLNLPDEAFDESGFALPEYKESIYAEQKPQSSGYTHIPTVSLDIPKVNFEKAFKKYNEKKIEDETLFGSYHSYNLERKENPKIVDDLSLKVPPNVKF